MDSKDIKRLISYAGFGHSNDEPFEFVFPPTRTPEAQLLLLQEVLSLTGIPIEQAGIQINFGGLNDRNIVKAIQRIIISAGKLDPDLEMIKENGSYWRLPLQESFKGEVNIRENAHEKVEDIMGDTKNEYGYKSVGEMRASMGSTNFFVFARGLFEARRLADHAKAYEQVQLKESVLGIEIEMADKFNLLLSEYNKVCQKNNLPEINKSWSKENWRNFGEIMLSKEKSQYFKTILKKFV